MAQKQIDPQKTIFLIDGSSFLYRAYYSLPPMHTKTGEPVQVVYGFCRMVRKLLKRFEPQYIGVVWDPSREVPTKRHEMYAQYKEQRQSAPQELNAQRGLVKEFADTVSLFQIEKPGLEADDILYSLAKDFSDEGFSVVLVTSDKDMRQCVSDRIVIYDPFRDVILDREAVEKRYGIPLEKLVFYFALIGDASDNIPGARGIGPKTAQGLVNTFDSVEDLYARLDEVSKKRTKELLEASKDNVILSKKLFLLYYEPLKVDSRTLEFAPDAWFNARALFKRLGFASLLKEFPPVEGEDDEDEAGAIPAEFITVTDTETLNTMCDEIKTAGFCALDTEGTSLRPLDSAFVGFSAATTAGKAYYVPVGHQGIGAQLPLDVVIKACKPILEDQRIKKYFHHAKYDRLAFSTIGIDVAGTTFDTLIAAHLVTRDWQRINLKALSEFFLQQRMLTYDEVVKKKRYKTFAEVPLNQATPYAAADAHQTLALVPVLKKELEKHELSSLFYDLEMPLSNILYAMEKEGVGLDVKTIDIIEHEVEKAIDITQKKIAALLPEGVFEGLNLNSPRQLGELLFTTLQLPPVKKTGKKTGYSTDAFVLNELAKLHPVPALIVRYRELYKIKSTYLDALKAAINPNTNKIHTSFSQISTATGRLSSSDPNLQNIPTGMHSFAVRSAFVAPDEHVFLSADYSQIELRVLAYLSQDKTLVDAFLKGRDIHAQTAAGLFNTSIEEVEPDARALAKKINFSILYGLSPYGLSKDLGIPFKDAKSYIERYFEQYPDVVEWMESVIASAKKHGYVTTLFGRRRYVPGIYERNRHLYELARRVAINTVVQGTAAELMKKGMLDLDKQLPKENAKLLLQIHDELIYTVREDAVKAVQPMVCNVLETVVDWNIPLSVTARTGHTWQEVTK